MAITFAEGLAWHKEHYGVEVFDLGHDHYGQLIDHFGKPCGVSVLHKAPDGTFCGTSAIWDVSSYPPEHKPLSWTLNSLEPLDLSPSILCGTCQDHGYIHSGRWQPA